MERILEKSEGDRVVWIPAGRVVLEARLALPPGARGIVVLGWMHEPRTQYIAHALGEAGLGTLMVDLVTPEEAAEDQQSMRHRYDLRLLARRLAEITHWLKIMGPTKELLIGHLAYGPDVAATLSVAADLPREIRAIVAVSGHPRDAGAALANVDTPTLLIVAGNDGDTVGANREALADLHRGSFVVVPSARHRFEDSGALAEAARLSVEWFRQQLTAEEVAPATTP